MHPVTVFPTRRAPDWRRPALFAAAGLAATAMYLLGRQAPLPWTAWRARRTRRPH
ncbi:MAG: hypothetical protein ACJ8HI_17645 [Massilia sp.]